MYLAVSLLKLLLQSMTSCFADSPECLVVKALRPLSYQARMRFMINMPECKVNRASMENPLQGHPYATAFRKMLQPPPHLYTA